MKRQTIILTVALLACALSALAFYGKDTPITFSQLPTTAQQMIKKHFPNSKIALAKMENEVFSKSYEVIFTNGDKLEFDGSGNWTSVDCKYTQVPAAIIPPAIMRYLKAHYPQMKVKEIERNRRYYQVELRNGIDLKFNKKYQLVEID